MTAFFLSVLRPRREAYVLGVGPWAPPKEISLLIHLFFVLLAREVVRFEGLFRQFREFVGSEAEVVYTPIPVLKQRRYSSNSVFDALVKGYVGYGGTVLQ